MSLPRLKITSLHQALKVFGTGSKDENNQLNWEKELIQGCYSTIDTSIRMLNIINTEDNAPDETSRKLALENIESSLTSVKETLQIIIDCRKT